MKLQKVYDAAHREVKIASAETGKSSLRIASQLIRHGYKEWRAGRIALPESEDESAEVVVLKRNPAAK